MVGVVQSIFEEWEYPKSWLGIKYVPCLSLARAYQKQRNSRLNILLETKDKGHNLIKESSNKKCHVIF